MKIAMKTIARKELILLFFLILNTLNAQVLNTTTEVISNGGSKSSGGIYENFCVIGETFSNYPVSGEEYITSQGFLYLCNGIPTYTESVVIKEMRIYPNPAHSLIRIDMPDNKSCDQIEVIDIYGKIILSLRFQEIVNLGQLSPGTYFLLIKDKNGRLIISSRIIKI